MLRHITSRLLPLPITGTVREVKYEWDNGKAAVNFRKHGVDFADAIAALEDTKRVEEIDTRFVYIVYGPRRGHMQNHIGPEGHTT